MKRMTAIISIVLLLSAAATGFAQTEQDDGEPPQFVADLAALLEGGDFTGEEIAALVTAAQDLDWDEAGEADPAVVALALELSEQNGEDLEPGDQARLARELALTAVEMENEGYEQRIVARAAIEGAREVRNRVQEWKRDGEPQELGERIRNTVRERVVEVARERGDAEGSGRAEEARNRAGGSPSDPAGDRAPGSAPGNPGR